MISVICVYNDRSELRQYLLKGLERQNVESERVLLDNTTGTFESAARALNVGAARSTGDILLFAHQDVEFLTSDFLRMVEVWTSRLPDVGIAGVAGAREASNHLEVVSCATHGTPPWSPGRSAHTAVPVQTVDECLAAVPKQVFRRMRFDEDCLPSWHLYTVDYSLSVRGLGLKAYVIPQAVYHRSIGGLSGPFFDSLGRLVHKHKHECRRIYTTTGVWSTLLPIWFQKRRIFVLRQGRKLQNTLGRCARPVEVVLDQVERL